MKKSHAVLATSAVFLSAALVASYFQFQQPTIKATEVLTWDCGSAVYKPESITLTCADGGWSLQQITWTSWTEQGAEGTGTFTENLCKPSCSEGEFVKAEVKVKLSNLIVEQEKHYLRTLDIQTQDGKDFPWGRAGMIEWNLRD
jgi:hypothetical protein